MKIDIKETEIFKKAIKKERINSDDLKILKDELRENPEKGDLIPNSGGYRKIRMAINNTGKSGGARVVYFYISLKGRIYLVTAYKKGSKENLTPDDMKILRKLSKSLKSMED